MLGISQHGDGGYHGGYWEHDRTVCAKRDKGYDSGYDSLVVHIERHGKKYEMAGKAVAQAVETEIQEEERRYQKQESEIWCRRHEFFSWPMSQTGHTGGL